MKYLALRLIPSHPETHRFMPVQDLCMQMYVEAQFSCDNGTCMGTVGDTADYCDHCGSEFDAIALEFTDPWCCADCQGVTCTELRKPQRAVNPFKACLFGCAEAQLAYDYWTLGADEMNQDILMKRTRNVDQALANVYMEWLDEYCHDDLSRRGTEAATLRASDLSLEEDLEF